MKRGFRGTYSIISEEKYGRSWGAQKGRIFFFFFEELGHLDFCISSRWLTDCISVVIAVDRVMNMKTVAVAVIFVVVTVAITGTIS